MQQRPLRHRWMPTALPQYRRRWIFQPPRGWPRTSPHPQQLNLLQAPDERAFIVRSTSTRAPRGASKRSISGGAQAIPFGSVRSCEQSSARRNLLIPLPAHGFLRYALSPSVPTISLPCYLRNSSPAPICLKNRRAPFGKVLELGCRGSGLPEKVVVRARPRSYSKNRSRCQRFRSGECGRVPNNKKGRNATR